MYVLSYVESLSSTDSEIAEKVDVAAPYHVLTRATLSHFAASFPHKYSDSDSWKIMPGNLDLAHLALFQRLPSYDFYWFCEDDVRFTGRFGTLIDMFSRDMSDLISTNWRTAPPGWVHLSSLLTPSGESLPESPNICFLPFFRASRRMLTELVDAYRHGLSGHHEITWPYVVESRGLIGRDFNQSGRELYTSCLRSHAMAPGTFVYRPSRLMAGFRRNRLYHPVKPNLDVMEDTILRWLSRAAISTPKTRYLVRRVLSEFR